MQPVRFLGGFVRDHFMGPVKKMAETFVFADRLLRSTENKLKKTPVQDALKLFNKKAFFSIAIIRDNLNYEPNVDLKNGLKCTAEWIRHHGLISHNDNGT